MLPLNNFMRVSVALMIVHQFVAFALYVTPLIFMFERLWGSHNARWFIRMPLRLPVGACHALSPAEFLSFLSVCIRFITAPPFTIGDAVCAMLIFMCERWEGIRHACRYMWMPLPLQHLQARCQRYAIAKHSVMHLCLCRMGMYCKHG